MKFRRRLLSLTGLLALSLAPLPNPSSSLASSLDYTFAGAGFGHGIGLSQYGAKGAAEAGNPGDWIVRHFYQGTRVEGRPMPPEIRLGLVQGASEITVSGTGRLEFRIDGVAIAAAPGNENWRIRPTSTGAYQLLAPDGRQWTYGDPSRGYEVRFEEFGTILRTSGHNYRYGYLELNTHSVGGNYALRSILHVGPFERYLYGLAEMPSSWHIEALKAQAIAGRTYAVEKMARTGGRPDCNCHLFADTRDQAYAGYDKETGASGDRWRSAVDATASLVATYNGSPIQAYYHSSSGGHTEDNEKVWGGSPLAYLRGVGDPWDLSVSPHGDWRVTFSSSELETRLNSSGSTAVGALNSIELLDPKGVSGRITQVIDANRGGVRITGASGTKRVAGETLRSVLGLRSTLFRLESAGFRGPTHPDGVMIKGSSDEIWLLKGGSRYHLPSLGVLESRARLAEVVRVSDASVESYPVAKLTFRDGSLLRTGDGRIWVISNGVRRHVTSGDQFDALGYSYQNVIAASAADAALHREGKPLTSSDRHPDGSLVKGSGAQVWMIENGRRRHVPSHEVLDSQFPSTGPVRASDAEIASLPQGPALGFRNGSLIRTPDGAFWAISNGFRRHISSVDTFYGLGLSPSNARQVSYAEGELHPVGIPLSSPSTHPDGLMLKASAPEVWLLTDGTLRHVPSLAVLESHFRTQEIVGVSGARMASYSVAKVRFAEGTLIRTDDGRIWVISNGLRRHVTSGAVFDGLGYSYQRLFAATGGDASLHHEGEPLTTTDRHPDGSLVKGSGSEVWLIETGKRRHVPSSEILDSQFPSRSPINASDAELNSLPQGLPLGFRDGSLIRTPDGAIWAISGGLRRHVNSIESFYSLGFSPSNIRSVSFGEADAHSEGPPLST